MLTNTRSIRVANRMRTDKYVKVFVKVIQRTCQPPPPPPHYTHRIKCSRFHRGEGVRRKKQNVGLSPREGRRPPRKILDPPLVAPSSSWPHCELTFMNNGVFLIVYLNLANWVHIIITTCSLNLKIALCCK